MSNLLEQTEIVVKSKRLERNSGKLPSKLRLTSATKLSLQKNIDHKFLEKAIAKLNTIYSEMISAVEIAERAKAEEEARNKMSGNANLEAKIEADEKIYKLTSEDVVVPRLRKVTIELLKLAGRIGTYKDNYAINVKKGFTSKSPVQQNYVTAKAINVQKLYADVYKSVMNKIDLYKMAEKKGLELKKDGQIVTKNVDVPSWRKLFNNVNTQQQNVTVAMSKPKDDDEEKDFVPVSSKKVSEEDINYRKMLSQLGDEFQLIEDYEKSPSGVPSQFKSGFEQRKNNLSKIFFDLTGIDSSKKPTVEVDLKDNTEFQNLIDEVNGYKEPMSEEEHKKMEESLNEYYNSDEVSQKISELNEKDVLFTFNQHMDDVIKAESLQNSQTATVSVKESQVETSISEEELAKQRELAELKKGAEEQARMLKTLYDYIDKRDKFEEEKAERERKERIELLNGAEEQAKILHERNQVIDLAHKEAQRIIEDELKNQADAKEQMMIKQGAKEEANRIFKEELKAVQEKENKKMIKQGAKEQAQMLHDRNIIIDGAEEQAQMLHENNIILDSAEEEAKKIYQGQQDELKKGAKEQAQMLYDKDLIYEGAKEQALKLQQNNELDYIKESAEVQAKILLNKNKKDRLLQEALELSEKLKSINAEADKIDDMIDEMVDKDDEVKNTVEEQPKSSRVKTEDAFFDEEIISSAEEEAKRLYDQNIIADSAEVEAKKLYEQNIIANSAEVEAKKLYEQNIIADSAEKEAQRLYDQDMISNGAEVEAKRLYEQNVMIESAEEEAKKILNATMTRETEVERKTTTNVAPVTNDNNLLLLNNNDRYAELTNKSNALLVKKSRIDNINKRVNNDSVENVNAKKKEMLNSLKEELASENFDFLRRNDEQVESENYAKAA